MCTRHCRRTICVAFPRSPWLTLSCGEQLSGGEQGEQGLNAHITLKKEENRGCSSPESTVTASLQGRGICTLTGFSSPGSFYSSDITCHFSYNIGPFTCHILLSDFQHGEPYVRVSAMELQKAALSCWSSSHTAM